MKHGCKQKHFEGVSAWNGNMFKIDVENCLMGNVIVLFFCIVVGQ
jgi:hypothetical protein